MTQTYFHCTSSAHQPYKIIGNDDFKWTGELLISFSYLDLNQHRSCKSGKPTHYFVLEVNAAWGRDQQCGKAPPLFLQSPKPTMTRCGNVKLIQFHKANLTKIQSFQQNYRNFPNQSVHLTLDCLILVYLFSCCMSPWGIKHKLHKKMLLAYQLSGRI